MKLRALLILATMVLGGMLLSGVVLAKQCDNNCKGTNSSDTLIGDKSNNTLKALRGPDLVKGLQGVDSLYGNPGNDGVKGGPGKDFIDGGTGGDRLNGQGSGDIIRAVEFGVSSSTARQKQRTVDVVIGGRGNDTIRARDGKKDIIRGGPGRDKAYVDQVDKVTGVEKEVVRGGGGLKQCNDGIDNDGDGKTDLQDPGCASATDNTESPDQPTAPPQCNDGKDNDNDGKIDFGTGANNDPGCESATDNTESPDQPTAPPQCNDGKDNDNDGKIDFGTGANNDPGCDSLTDDSESPDPVAPNNPPVANGDCYKADSNDYVKVNDGADDLLSNDTDADNPNNTNAGLTVKDAQPVKPPADGQLTTLNADGSFEYDVDFTPSQPVSFTYKATDGTDDSNEATVTINFDYDNPAPPGGVRVPC